MKLPPQNPEQEFYWFPTQEEQGDPTTDTPVQQRIYNNFLELRELAKLNPQDDETSRKSIRSKFDRSNTTLSTEEQQQIEISSLNFTTILPDICLT